MKTKLNMGKLQHLLNLALNAAGAATDETLSEVCRRCAAATAMTTLAEAGFLLEPLARELNLTPVNVSTIGIPEGAIPIVEAGPLVIGGDALKQGGNSDMPSYLRLKRGELN